MSARDIPSLNALRAFEAVARLGTFARAADELCVTPSAVGHQVRALEEWLGTGLFAGHGPARRLTADGQRLASVLGDGFDQFYLACRAVKRSRGNSELHVNVTPTFAIRWLVPRLGNFHARHRDIILNIATSAAPIDSENDVVDAAIRFGRPPWPGLTAELLFLENVFPVCHPSLLDGGRHPAGPGWLKDRTLLHTAYRRADWERWLRAAGADLSQVDPSKGLVFDLTTMAIDAAEAGLGVAISREAQVERSLQNGDLVAPFRRDLLSGEGCYLLMKPERQSDPVLSAFRQWLLREAALR